MADSSLEPDNWCVVNHLPFTDVYGVALPTQRFFAVIRSFPLQRIPTERDGARPYRQDMGSGQNRPNAIAFLVAATGEEMPADLCCTRCAPVHRGGQWEGCFISAATDDCQEKFSYSCSNCVYHGEKTRCSLFSTQRPGIFRPGTSENPTPYRLADFLSEGLEDADPLPLTEAEQFRAQGEPDLSFFFRICLTHRPYSRGDVGRARPHPAIRHHVPELPGGPV